MTWTADLALARRTLATGNTRLVIVKDSEIVTQSDDRGITALLDYAADPIPEDRGASMADRAVGKAAALLAVASGIVAVYTPLMSEPAFHVLNREGIQARFGTLVSQILNRPRTDLCPLESLVAGIQDPRQALEEISRWCEIQATRAIGARS